MMEIFYHQFEELPPSIKKDARMIARKITEEMEKRGDHLRKDYMTGKEPYFKDIILFFKLMNIDFKKVKKCQK